MIHLFFMELMSPVISWLKQLSNFTNPNCPINLILNQNSFLMLTLMTSWSQRTLTCIPMTWDLPPRRTKMRMSWKMWNTIHMCLKHFLEERRSWMISLPTNTDHCTRKICSIHLLHEKIGNLGPGSCVRVSAWWWSTNFCHWIWSVIIFTSPSLSWFGLILD